LGLTDGKARVGRSWRQGYLLTKGLKVGGNIDSLASNPTAAHLQVGATEDYYRGGERGRSKAGEKRQVRHQTVGKNKGDPPNLVLATY